MLDYCNGAICDHFCIFCGCASGRQLRVRSQLCAQMLAGPVRPCNIRATNLLKTSELKSPRSRGWTWSLADDAAGWESFDTLGRGLWFASCYTYFYLLAQPSRWQVQECVWWLSILRFLRNCEVGVTGVAAVAAVVVVAAAVAAVGVLIAVGVI